MFFKKPTIELLDLKYGVYSIKNIKTNKKQVVLFKYHDGGINHDPNDKTKYYINPATNFTFYNANFNQVVINLKDCHLYQFKPIIYPFLNKTARNFRKLQKQHDYEASLRGF